MNSRSAARQLNKYRRKSGPPGDLVALRFTGETEENVNVCSPLKTYAAGEAVNGWRAHTVRGDDGAHFTRITVADVDGELAALVDGDNGLTHFAIGGPIFQVERDQTKRPLTEPFVWVFRSYVTGDVYEA